MYSAALLLFMVLRKWFTATTCGSFQLGEPASPSLLFSANCGWLPPEPTGRSKYSGMVWEREPITPQPMVICHSLMRVDS